eukprot:maker-scaffold507_size152468-snap-gene-0.39 protein:Tk11921 transcript:maker-scaffold507_size152468-snap-gene-0.39-mRNA-1 annotation:"upf0504 protein"
MATGTRPTDVRPLVTDQDDEDTGSAGPASPPPLTSGPFVRLATLPATAVAITANVIMIVLVFLLPILCEGGQKPHGSSPPPGGGEQALEVCHLEPFSILVYTHAGHWLIHLVVDQYLKKEHKKSRLRGYIQFYLQTKNIRRTPFYLVSIGNAVLLITVTALHDYCDPDLCPDKMMKVDYLRGLITLECLVIICLWFNYIINVREFHAQRPLPDVLNNEAMRQMLVDFNSEAGYDDSIFGASMAQDEKDEILEKQAELIRYLRSHIGAQNERLVNLASQIPIPPTVTTHGGGRRSPGGDGHFDEA